MTPEFMLIEAQMHLEYMTAALCKNDDRTRGELGARVWAASYLLQAARTPGEKPDDFDEVLREANAYSGGEDVNTEEMH